MPTIFFSHGKFSHPNSTKITFLAAIAQEMGCATHSIDYTSTIDPEERVALLRKEAAKYKYPEEELILVGSSMGGYVATVLASELAVKGLFLMAPAFYLPTYKVQNFTPKGMPIEIVHGWKDEAIPFEQSIQFGARHAARLHLVEDNHRLSNSHTFLKESFRSFLKRLPIE